PTPSTPPSTTTSISISSATLRRWLGSSAWASSSWSIRPSRPKRFPSSSPTRRPIPARSITRRWAAAPPPTWPASCSERWPASTGGRCPIAAITCPTCSAGRCRRRSLPYCNRWGTSKRASCGRWRGPARRARSRCRTAPPRWNWCRATKPMFGPRAAGRGDAGGNRRTTQQRDQRRALGSGNKGAVCELRCGTDADDAGRVRDLHSERNREVGQGRQDRAHQGGLNKSSRRLCRVRAASGHAVVAQARSALPLKTHMRARRLVEAHHGVGTAVFAGARGRSLLAPANLALWKVDEELDGVVQPSVVDFPRCNVGLLVFVEHLPASRLFLPLVPRPVGLALEHAVKQLIVCRRRVLQMGNLEADGLQPLQHVDVVHDRGLANVDGEDQADDPTEHQQYRDQCQNETQHRAGSRGEVEKEEHDGEGDEGDQRHQAELAF